MSIHPSLASSDKDKKQKSVLKRTERIKTMVEKGAWKEGDKVFGLPKIKTLRIKIKKEKIEKAETATTGEASAAPAAAAPAAAKPSSKTQEKK
jgi:small basic protein (TIGR04137 family)